jgi:hypothetical protein
VCDILKLKSEPYKFVFIGLCHFILFGQKALQNSTIFTQRIIYIPYQVIGRAFEPVIVATATGVVTKLFIGSPPYLFATVQANA